jgi:16S rRNA C1402 N4-methylase RsmH
MPVSQWLKQSTYQDILDLITNETDFGESLRNRISKQLSVDKRKQEFTTTGQFRDRAKSNEISDKMLAVLFQAFRILVNNELKELDTFLQSFMTYLSP